VNVALTGKPLKILDFDIECRPLSWYGGDFVTREITAIAWKFIGERYAVRCLALGETPSLFTDDGRYDIREDLRSIIANFREAFDRADAVTGHFIRGFDLPVLNTACLELGLPLLGEKLTHDTKNDLVKLSGLSKSQENLGATLGLVHEKVGMDQDAWREANRLTPEGIAKTKKRVTGDVLQHIELRQRLLDQGLLGPMKLWTPHASGAAKYHA